MIELLAPLIAAAPLSPGANLWLGRAAFIATYVVLAFFILFLPAKLLGDENKLSWWRSSRVWALAIIAAQIGVYWWWG